MNLTSHENGAIKHFKNANTSWEKIQKRKKPK